MKKSNRELLDEAIFLYPGWAKIIENLDDLINTVDSEYQIDQIKEKFGGLRYYITNSDKYRTKIKENFPAFIDPVSLYINNAQRNSFLTCENCGKKDSEVETRPNEGEFWIRTLCKKCREE